jgi:pyrimidine-nucleoside phosphorylase
VSTHDAVTVIAKKRDGLSLSADEIAFMVRGISGGSIPDYQAAAFLMAVAVRGMDGRETAALCDAVLASGEILDHSSIAGVKADKHSTGGVGDKTSLVLAPLAATCGLKVPMISGRGLGHTGGTLDKLESIPGFRTDLEPNELHDVLERVGCFISGQTRSLVPADGIMYALRDVTATVPSLPLILASIVSKKIAEGAEAIVFDVKAGSGTFAGSADRARKLAEGLVRLSAARGLRAGALVTDMSQPLGLAVGNALEVMESVDVLRGGGPRDVRELVLGLGTRMLELAGSSPVDARSALEKALSSGAALETFQAMIAAQGGDPGVLDEGFPAAAGTAEIRAPGDGFVAALDAGRIGRAALALGAGRRTRDEAVDHAAGIVLKKKVGDPVSRGECVAVLHAGRAGDLDEARALFEDGFRSVSTAVVPGPLMIDEIETPAGGPMD